MGMIAASTIDSIFPEKFREMVDRSWHLGTRQVGRLERGEEKNVGLGTEI